MVEQLRYPRERRRLFRASHAFLPHVGEERLRDEPRVSAAPSTSYAVRRAIFLSP